MRFHVGNLILLQTHHNEVNSDFGISVNPTTTGGAYYAHHITTLPPLTLCEIESFLILKFIVNRHMEVAKN